MKYMAIDKVDVANGEGLRTVLYVSGCSHHCKGCQNPETWNYDAGKIFDEQVRDEIFTYLSSPYIDGLTLTGGDPLYCDNIEGVELLCKQIKEKFKDKDIWLYTGYTYEEICHLPLLKYIDVLVDGRFMKDLADNNLKWRGSSNQRILRLKDGNIQSIDE